MYTNRTIKKLLDDHLITQEQFNILFEPKDTWYTESNEEQDWRKSQDKIEKFDEVLKFTIKLIHKDNTIDLSYIYFPPFTFNLYEMDTDKNISFEGAHFCDKANFRNVTFTKKADFWKSVFMHDADFREATFENLADFNSAIFKNRFILRDCKFAKLKLNDTEVENPNLLNMSAYDEDIKHGKPLSKTNFENKETARLIKAHLEMQNNITESNKYFALEQELYLAELLKSTSTEPNKWQTIITLFLNKYVSHFGTDWLRSLIVLIITGYIVIIGYMVFDSIGWILNDKDIVHFDLSKYLFFILPMIASWGFMYRYTFTKDIYQILFALLIFVWAFIIADTKNLEIWALSNYIVQITNPIGAFKDVELYKGIEFYATIVRITIAVMIYQFIVAFRNNTRRS